MRPLGGAGLLLALLCGCNPLVQEAPSQTGAGAAGGTIEKVRKASTLNTGFQENTVLSGRTKPVSLRFAPNGMAFVAEKSGLVFEFDNLLTGQISPHQVIDLSAKVMNYWDRGLLGLAVHPNFPTVPEIYVLYAHDAFADGTGPRWNDNCPDPPNGPGANDKGCVVYGRLSRIVIDMNTMTGTEVPLISSNWCQQFPSHSIGDMHFGADGYLYLSAGDGASFTFVDYGQEGLPPNPCGDPPNPLGTADSDISTAEGGRLRAQDILSSGDPVSYDGSVLRLDVSGATVTAPPTNPLVGKGTTADDYVVAVGLRNPFRWNFRPGTNELWIGDVGDATWEEIDRLPDPTAGVSNFGWPCYEGPDERPVFRGNTLCDKVYASNFASGVSPMTLRPPYYAYNHAQPFAPNETGCLVGSSSVTGIAFNDKTLYPAAYKNALFVADYSRKCVWYMPAGPNGDPDVSKRAPFLQSMGNGPVDIQMGPDGRLYYVDQDGGSIVRIDYFQSNQPPQARVTASPTSGIAPLMVTFDARTSSDAEDGTNLTYAWDLDNDGQFDDGTGGTISYTFTQSGLFTVRVRATDSLAATSVAQVSVNAGNSPPVPVIGTVTPTTPWTVGQTITFNGSATDPQEGTLPASSLTWSILMHHCQNEAMNDCHIHTVSTITGVTSGSFAAPDHDYPSYLELKLTATDHGSRWYDAAWGYRRTLLMDNSAQNNTLTDMPVLVVLNSTRIDYSKVQAGGRDLRFTDGNNNVLSHEIESWDPAGTSYIWVKVPMLAASSNVNTMYLYYGNPNATDVQNAAAVWSNGYVGVWHLGSSLADSSPQGRAGTASGSSVVAGAVGSGRSFDGASFITIGDSAALQLSGNFTMEAWAKSSNASGTSPRILAKKQVWTGATGYSLELNPGSDTFSVLGAGTHPARGSSPINGLFHYYVASVTGGDTVAMYADGVGVTIDPAIGAVATSTDPLYLARAADGSYFTGVIDEVRLSNVARGVSWVAAQNLSMTDRLITYGVEEASTAASASTSVNLQPQSTLLSFTSNPSGLSLQVGNNVSVTPFSARFLTGGRVTVSAPSPQNLGGFRYGFTSWSDGGAATHILTTPASDTSYGVTYTSQGAVTDTDGDGMTDMWETANGFNPNSAADAAQDADGDRLTNLQEFNAGTNPRNADSDADGWDDFTEVTFGGNPNNGAVAPNPPRVTVTAPTAGGSVVGPSVSVSDTVAGIMLAGDDVGLSLDGAAEVSATGASATRVFSNVAAGAHSVRARVRNASQVPYTHMGASVTVNFTVTAPVVCNSNLFMLTGAQSSSDYSSSFAAAAAIDGNTSTRWSSAFSDPQWLLVDLGAARHVSRVVLNWEGAASGDYDIQVSGSTAGPWTTLYTNPNGDGGIDDITVSGTGRYVRMYSRRRIMAYGNSLYEVQVYGDTNTSCGGGGPPAPVCGNGVVETGEQCDDGNTVDTDFCSNTCITATCSDGVQNHGETGVDCGGPCAACGPTHVCGNGIVETGEQCDDGNTVNTDFCSNTCISATCSDGIQNHGETGVDCGGPCSACAPPPPVCGNGILEAGEQCDDGNTVNTDNCTNLCKTATCTDGAQNHGETGVDCGGPCAACAGGCQSNPLAITAATASSAYNGSFAASAAIDGSLATRWSSTFSDPQWLIADLGVTRHVSRVVLRWEAAASSSYDVQVGDSTSGPWTTLYTTNAGDGGNDDLTVSGNGRYVRMYSRARTTPYGDSLYEIEVYGDINTACGGGAPPPPVCGNGVLETGEQCDDGNTVNSDNCSNTCITATCTDGVLNHGETGVDCGGPCAACAPPPPVCGNGVVEAGEQCDDGNAVNTDSCTNACITATCTDGAQNHGETGVDCGGPCAACTTCGGAGQPACGGNTCLANKLTVASASSSSNYSSAFAAAAAIDGSLSTRWSSTFSDPQWIVLDMGAAVHISRAVLRWEDASSANFDLDVADSAAGPWTTLRAAQSGPKAGVSDLTGLSANKRFVRMYSRARTTPYGDSLYEFEIYGDPSTTCTP
jgi:cysteine-rich repeat protein